jgi:hypothetical protein
VCGTLRTSALAGAAAITHAGEAGQVHARELRAAGLAHGRSAGRAPYLTESSLRVAALDEADIRADRVLQDRDSADDLRPNKSTTDR